MEKTQTAKTGAVLVLLSALAFSLAGVLTKSIQADAWTIACWRGLIGGVLIAGYVSWARSEAGRRLSDRFRLGPGGWLVAGVGAASSVAFIFAFKMTFVANVAVIYATVPFMAAGLGWIALRERVDGSTLGGAAICALGVAIVVGGGIGTDRLAGDAMAVLMTAGNAAYMVLIRVYREGAVVWAGAVSALLIFVVSWMVTDPMQVSRADAVLIGAFGVAFAVAVVLWTEGAKRLPAAESGLLGLAETPFAILLAALILSELPAPSGWLGGGLVLAVVFLHALRRRRL